MRRFFRLGRVKDIAREVDDELAFHLEQLTRALIGGGKAPAAAREEALRRLGDIDAVREDLVRVDRRDAARRSLLERCHDWVLDLRFGARALRRAPGMTITVVLLLALGIGANTAIFGIIDHLLLRPPPHLVDPGRLERIGIESRWANQVSTHITAAYPDLAEYSRVAAFSSVAAYFGPSAVKYGPDSSFEVMQTIATPLYFRTLGTRAMLGRTFDSSDTRGTEVAVVSSEFWQARLGGTPAALGRRIVVDGRSYAVVGVMPAGFTGIEAGATDVWTMDSQSGLPPSWFDHGMEMWFAVARLKPGASMSAATAQVEAVRAARTSYRSSNVPDIAHLGTVIPGRALIRYGDRPARLSLLVGIVAILLLAITIANVTHVLMVRAMTREREFAVRVALGAGWRRVMRLVLVESTLLAGVGAVFALLVALGAGYAFRALLLPRYHWATAPVGLAGGALAAVLALAIALTTGTLPALLARRRDTLAALRTGTQTGRGWRGGLRLPLVTGQVAISIVLVGGAGLFALSLARIGTADHGMDLRHMLDTPVTLDSGPAWRQQLDDIEMAASRVPGVASVTAAQDAPYRGWAVFLVRGEPSDSPVGTIVVPADRNFFTASGLRVVQGRPFAVTDIAGSERVAVITQALADRLWHGASALGRCVYTHLGGAELTCVRVVGVSGSARIVGLHEEEAERRQLYLPLAQHWTASHQPHPVELLVRTAGNPDELLNQVRRAIAPLVPGHRVTLKSYGVLMQSDIRPWRVGLLLLGIAATLAALLTAVGLYAVMAFSVRQRYHELGVRRALGAQARHVVGVVVARSWTMVAIGAAVGVAGMLYAGRFLAPMLFETSPHDPLAIAWPVIALVGTAAAASVIPALTALRINPRDALQAD